MIELEDAVARILAALPSPEPERLPLAEAHLRFLAETQVAAMDLPAFDNAAMDGYAVRAEDVANASPDHPVRLRLRARVAAGDDFAGLIGPGECARIFTGSLLPTGTDAVVMQEDTRVEAASPGEVLICDGVKPWENVRFRGGDVKQGAVAAAAGEKLTAARLALLAALGVVAVNVGQRPRVAVLATGSELREAGQPLSPGCIYESNRAALAALVREVGGRPRPFPLLPDALPATRLALEEAFAHCDLVVTCGGVSVGEMDFVKSAFTELGGEIQFWQVAIRPGKPFVFGRCRGKLLFGLPGNPVSAFVTFLLLVRPALLRWQGATDTGMSVHPGRLAESLVNQGGRRHFMRVRLDSSGNVFSAGLQASHALVSLAGAEGLVDVPPGGNLAAGTMVTVLRWS